VNLLGVVTAASSIGVESIIIRPKRSLGPIVAQVTIEEVHDDEMEITEHPVEQGAAIADHAYKRPARLRLHARWSNSPSVSTPFEGLAAGVGGTFSTAQALIAGNAESQARDTYAKLLKLQVERVPFDVVTGKRSYRDMLIRGLTVSTNKELEHTLDAVINLQQVLITTTQTFALATPAERLADPEANQGAVSRGVTTPLITSKFLPLMRP
jgi:hypothetical protein